MDPPRPNFQHVLVHFCRGKTADCSLALHLELQILLIFRFVNPLDRSHCTAVLRISEPTKSVPALVRVTNWFPDWDHVASQSWFLGIPDPFSFLWEQRAFVWCIYSNSAEYNMRPCSLCITRWLFPFTRTLRWSPSSVPKMTTSDLKILWSLTAERHSFSTQSYQIREHCRWAWRTIAFLLLFVSAKHPRHRKVAVRPQATLPYSFAWQCFQKCPTQSYITIAHSAYNSPTFTFQLHSSTFKPFPQLPLPL